MTIRFAPKLLTAAAVLGAALFAAAPASAQYYGHPGPGMVAPPPAHYGPPPHAHPQYRPPRRWGWRHHHRPPPPWAYGPRQYGYRW